MRFDLSAGWGHCIVFLDKTLYSHSASSSAQEYNLLRIGKLLGQPDKMLGVTWHWTSIPPVGVAIPHRRNFGLSAALPFVQNKLWENKDYRKIVYTCQLTRIMRVTRLRIENIDHTHTGQFHTPDSQFRTTCS